MNGRLSGAPLAEKGYLPLPVAQGDKFPRMRGWQNVEEWKGEAPGLGVNLRRLVMVDIDLDVEPGSADDEVINRIIEYVGSEAPIRQRPGSTRCALLFAWDADATERQRLWTGKWPQGRVEIKAGNGEFCFGWGEHPSGGSLIWDLDARTRSADPADFPSWSELPAIDRPLEELRSGIEALLEEAWGPPLEDGGTNGGTRVERDLRWDMRFTLASGEGGSWTLEELYEGPGTSVWVNLTPWRPSSDSGAGHLIHSDVTGGPMVVDFVTWTSHFLEEDYSWSTDISELMGELAFEPAALEVTQKVEHVERMQAAQLAEREHRLLFIREDGKFAYVDDPTSSLMTKEAAFFEFPPKERTKAAQRVARVVQRQVWDPSLPPLSVVSNTERGWLEHNTFCMPSHPPEGGDLGPFWAWFRRLIPDEEERRVLLQWLAYKARNPVWRSFAVVLVGPQGSGKGTFWQLIGKLWGDANVSSLSNIAGVYHAQYQDSLFQKLWVLIDEVSSEEAGTAWQDKRRSADRLKGFVEPQPSRKLLNIKGRKFIDTVVAASVGISTNHPDAIPTDADDRRFYVLNTGPEMAFHDVRAIQEWIALPENIGALWRYLQNEVDLGGFNHVKAPMTDAKRVMRESNRTDVEDAVGELLAFMTAEKLPVDRQTVDSFLNVRNLSGPERKAFKALFRKATTSVCVQRLTGGTQKVRLTDRSFLEPHAGKRWEETSHLRERVSMGEL